MPNFRKGFDEADRRKDVRMVSFQESGTPVSLCLTVPVDKDNRAAKVSRDAPDPCGILDWLQRF
jgi:hypothetical protein